MDIEEGTCWDDHWVLCGNQFDNKFHILKKCYFLSSQVVCNRYYWSHYVDEDSEVSQGHTTQKVVEPELKHKYTYKCFCNTVILHDFEFITLAQAFKTLDAHQSPGHL